VLALVGVRTATIEMNVHFLGAVSEGRITCQSEVVHRTRRTAAAEAKVHDAQGNLVAMGIGVFRVFEKKGTGWAPRTGLARIISGDMSAAPNAPDNPLEIA
jgi:hypothetical protein